MDGIGPEVFDCSGLIIRSVCDVMGTAVTDQTEGLRHVRDIWQAAQTGRPSFDLAELAVGTLLITRRIHTIGGEAIEVPGHVGIVTDTAGEIPSFIHAQAGAGKVEERPLLTLDTMLGCIAVNL
jgi:hypothetical protein